MYVCLDTNFLEFEFKSLYIKCKCNYVAKLAFIVSC